MKVTQNGRPRNSLHCILATSLVSQTRILIRVEPDLSAPQTVQPEVAKSLQDAASQQQAAEVQAGREAVQLAFIELARLKSVGKMKGSPWDPLPGNPMHFSDLMQLAAEQRVEFLDYGDHGQHVAGRVHVAPRERFL